MLFGEIKMPKMNDVFVPEKTPSELSSLCSFHIKGCCFDPQKKVDGFVAAPCFGCKDQNETFRENF